MLLLQQITGEEFEAFAEFICPLTKKMFKDPVTTSCGHTYEKEALLDYIHIHGYVDPVAKVPMDPKFFPNTVMKKATETMRHAQRSLD